MPKKQMKFKSGGKVKHYYTGSQVSKSSGSEDSSGLKGESLPPFDEMESINSDVRRALARNMRDKELPSSDPVESTNASVRRALAGDRPSAPEYKQLPESKDNKFVKAAKKVEKSQGYGTSRGMGTNPAPYRTDTSVPEPSTSEFKASAPEKPNPLREKFPGMASIYDYYASPSSMQGVKDNLSNTAMALTPLTGGASKVATEFALGNRAAKGAIGAEKLSPAGQRLKNMEEVRNVAMPGRNAAVTNPSAWTGGPKAMDKIAQVEARAAQAEAKAAQAAARKKAAQAKKDAKDPVMNAKPGADKAKNQAGYKYEGDEPFPPMYKKGGAVKKFAKGGSVSSASSRADGCAIRGKTKGTMSKMKSGGMYGGKGAC
jgi:hypothetical protein